MKGFIIWVTATFATLLGVAVADYDNQTSEQIGYTYKELQEMKKDCEKDLTRSENCIIVVSYKPETSKEQTEGK